jgi:hypothetical protein
MPKVFTPVAGSVNHRALHTSEARKTRKKKAIYKR